MQCVNVRAREVVEDLKAFMHGRGGGGGGGKSHHHRGGGGGHEIEVGDLSPYPEEGGGAGHGETSRMQVRKTFLFKKSVKLLLKKTIFAILGKCKSNASQDCFPCETQMLYVLNKV